MSVNNLHSPAHRKRVLKAVLLSSPGPTHNEIVEVIAVSFQTFQGGRHLLTVFYLARFVLLNMSNSIENHQKNDDEDREHKTEAVELLK